MLRKAITIAASALFSTFVLGGLAVAEPVANSSEPEPAGSCYGAQPICIGGSACCRCEIGGINCIWACCK